MTQLEEKKIKEIQDFVKEKGMENNYLVNLLMQHNPAKYDKENKYFKSIEGKYFKRRSNNYISYISIRDVYIREDMAPTVTIEEIAIITTYDMSELSIKCRTLSCPIYGRYDDSEEITKEEYNKVKTFTENEITKIEKFYKNDK